jgi:hypothetical protein
MRRLGLISCAVVLVGCAKSEQAAKDTTTPAAPAAAPGISLADVAGKWTVKGMSETGDTTLVTYELNATADTTGWTINFPNRPPVPVHVVSVAGDSIVIEAGPYESVLRKGVQVTTHGVSRLKDGKFVGTTIAHYSVKTADSVRTIKTEGTRAP